MEHINNKKGEHSDHMDHKNNKQHEHEDHMDHHIKDFRNRFIISMILTIPILLLSPLVQNTVGLELEFVGSKVLQYIISTIVFLYGGYPFLKGAIDEIKNKSIGMMTLIALAISIAYLYSTIVILGFEGEPFFWELVTLIDIMLLGHWIEMKSTSNASMALKKLSQLIPNKSHLKKGKDIIDVETSTLKSEDIILVKPGETIPIDGIIIKGNSFVNESLITGESLPISKSKNDKVLGGSINQDGSLIIKVKNKQENSYISKVIQLVSEAQASKSKTQALADKAAYWLTIIAISAGIITFLVWILITGNISTAITRTATVLVITCPHALGLAIPLVVAVSTTISAQNGLLIKNRTAFENSRKITTVVLDKTGTVTNGDFQISEIRPSSSEYSSDEVLKLVASLENHSEHSIGKAIVKEAHKRKIQLQEVENVSAIKGKGIKGEINGVKYLAISNAYAKELNLSNLDSIDNIGTVVNLVKGERNYELIARIILVDTIREGAKGFIDQLHKQDIEVVMLTGDNKKTAESVAKELNIDDYYAEVLPDEKQDKIKDMQKRNKYVAMVGDGVNDAPALAQADLGVAIGSGTDIAGETADIILVDDDLEGVLIAINFGKATYSKMLQNLIWATGYNLLAIPLAAGVLYPLGIELSPAVGAILMSLSTVIVAINARMLRLKN